MSSEAFWKESRYEIVITKDGSPSLKLLNHPQGEIMHHSGGAFAETQLIYGSLIREVLDQGGRSFLVVGLGLGYIELLIAEEALKRGIQAKDVSILSYESEDILKKSFFLFLEGQRSSQTEVYHQLFKFYDNRLNICQWLKDSRWKVAESLEVDFKIEQKFAAILYDAFSSKTSPHLWSEDFLEKFLKAVSEKKTGFSTYACTGNLKRALKKAGFSIHLREGFQSKRNSTLAYKEI